MYWTSLHRLHRLRALNNLHKMDLTNIALARTHRSLEVVFSNQVEVQHIKGTDHGIADYSSRMRQDTQEIPMWPKFEMTFKAQVTDQE